MNEQSEKNNLISQNLWEFVPSANMESLEIYFFFKPTLQPATRGPPRCTFEELSCCLVSDVMFIVMMMSQ